MKVPSFSQINSLLRPTLQKKFALVFIIIAATTILLLSNLALYLVAYSHRVDASNLQQQLVGQVEQELEKYLNDTLGIIDIRVSGDKIQFIDLSQQQFIAQGLLDEQPTFDEVSFISVTSEHVEGKLDRTFGTETLRLGRTGKQKNRDVSLLEFFTVPASGTRYIGSIEYTQTGPYVRIAAPVKNRNSDIIEVVSARINLQSLVSSIEKRTLGDSGIVFIVDKEGRLLAGRGMQKGETLSRYGRVSRVLAGSVQDGLSADDLYDGYGTRVPSVGSGKRLAATGWGIFTEWPLVDANRIIDEIRRTVFIAMFGFVLAAILLSYIVAHRLTVPIRLLKGGAGEIANGKLETKIAIDTDDELSDLGASFNTMAEGLKQLDHLRTEYMHLMTHELRSPLTAIRGYVSLLSEKYGATLTSEANQFLSIVKESADNLAALINDLLEIAKIESGKISLELGDIPVSEVVESAVAEMQVLAGQRSISISNINSEYIAIIRVDRMRLKQVLVNLLSNAIKYNKENGWIRVSCTIDGDGVVLTVEDGGVGMTPEQLSHLFEKFYRAKGQEKVVGTGLGLYITKILTEAMGGRMKVTSIAGIGSTFIVTFPRA